MGSDSFSYLPWGMAIIMRYTRKVYSYISYGFYKEEMGIYVNV